jgi:hypothetical protein
MPGDSSHTDSGLKGITEDVRRYIEKRLELFALTLSEQVSFILADSMQRLIGMLMIACGLLIAWFALSFYISELVGSTPLGFLISSLPLILGGLIFLKIKPKSITRAIQAGIIHEVMISFENLDNLKQKTKVNREKED